MAVVRFLVIISKTTTCCTVRRRTASYAAMLYMHAFFLSAIICYISALTVNISEARRFELFIIASRGDMDQ